MTIASITPRELKRRLHDGGEIAVLDVREEGVFAKGHLLLAASAPLSRLEMRAPLLVPRRSTRVVVVDGGEGLAGMAARRLVACGWSAVVTLEGGTPAWEAAGYLVYSGVNVPSKAFGELVEHAEGTPRMEPTEVKRRVDAGEKVVILDSRPLAEYRRMSIPGATDCPGAELVWRVHDLAPSPDTLVVVNCAGRTRSIIGAQSLINAGIPNRVAALKNGTMGWHLAGFELAHGRDNHAPEPSAAGIARAKAAAARVARRFGVKTIDVAGVARFAREMDRRTLYLFDVRSPGEYEAGHLHSTINAPGGQLVQTTDAFAATRNARICLIDDHGVRATMTASWLVQMGWKDVYVVKNALACGPLHKGPAPLEVPGLQNIRADTVTPTALARMLRAPGTVVVDFDSSLRYREGHVPGAWLAIRAHLAGDLEALPHADTLVFTSTDGVLATLAAADALALTDTPVKVLAGGTDAWRRARLPIETGMTHLANTTEDVWYRPYDRTSNQEEAMKDYLRWEIDLLEKIQRDDDVRFAIPARP